MPSRSLFPWLTPAAYPMFIFIEGLLTLNYPLDRSHDGWLDGDNLLDGNAVLAALCRDWALTAGPVIFEHSLPRGGGLSCPTPAKLMCQCLHSARPWHSSSELRAAPTLNFGE